MSATASDARELFEAEKYGECIERLGQLSIAAPPATEEARALTNLKGLCFMRLGDVASAEPLFRAVLAEDAEDMTAKTALHSAMIVVSRQRVERANELFKAGDSAQALELYNSVKEDEMDPATAFNLGNNRGALLIRESRFAEALASFEGALRHMPSDIDTLHNRGLALKALCRFDEALEAFDACLAVDATYYSALCGRSETLTALGRFEESVQVSDEAIKQRPDEPRAYSSRGFARLKTGAYESAIADLQDAKQRGFQSKDFTRVYSLALALQGDKLIAAGQHAKAIECYEKALSHGDHSAPSADMLFNLALAELSVGRTEDALKGMKHVLEINPQHYNAAAALGLHYVGTAGAGSEEAGLAVQFLTTACALRPQESEIAFHLGIACVKAADYAAAAKAFRATLASKPDHEQARRALSSVESQLALVAAQNLSLDAARQEAREKDAAPPAAVAEKQEQVREQEEKEQKEGEVEVPAQEEPAQEEPAQEEPAAPSPRTPVPLAEIDTHAESLSSGLQSPSVEHVSAAAAVAAETAILSGMAEEAQEDAAPTLGAVAPAASVDPLAGLSQMDTTGGALVAMEFALGELQFPGPYPDGIKVWCREEYLSDAEFLELFKMPKDDFKALPKWRRQAMKKSFKLW